MSYEGRIQVICKNGHYHEIDIYDGNQDNCHTCEERIIWRNGVDDTNGESAGYIKITPELEHICETCGHKVKIYCPPDLIEKDPQQLDMFLHSDGETDE